MFYAFGDGFAAGHIWPMWPQLLRAVTQESVTNYGHVGAGNEYIFNCAVKAALIAQPDDIFVVQWAQPIRFDKIMQDDNWQQLHSSDLIYNGISSTKFDQTWWATSASTLPEIQYYHNYYVQPEQAINRSALYMISLAHMLAARGIKYVYCNTYTIDYSTHLNASDLNKLNWVSQIGMRQWAESLHIEGAEIQPPPATHLKYVLECVLPSLKIDIPATKHLAITQLINNVKWAPSFWDRDKVWEDLQNEIGMLFK